jgi:hypothetical protein
VYALLLDDEASVRQLQLAHLRAEAEPGTAAAVEALSPLITPLGAGVSLPLVELALPALRQLSSPQYERFRDRVEYLVASDRKLSLFEFALRRMLRRHLDPQFRKGRRAVGRYVAVGRLADHLAVLLSSLVYAGHGQRPSGLHAFSKGKERFGMPREIGALLPREACSLAGLDMVLDRLAAAAPQVKARVLDACAACIASDGLVTVAEAEMLRAIADSLDCPMPPLLAGPLPPPQPAPTLEPTRERTAGHPAPLRPS